MTYAEFVDKTRRNQRQNATALRRAIARKSAKLKHKTKDQIQKRRRDKAATESALSHLSEKPRAGGKGEAEGGDGEGEGEGEGYR
jgi:hypothetical protein